MRDSFIMLPTEPNGSTVRAHLFLTTEVLVVCRELSPNRYLLIYPAISIGDITVKSESVERELVGEYIIRFSVLGKKHILMRAETKEIRNTWIGVDMNASNTSIITTPRTLSVAAQKKMLSNGIGSNKYSAIELKLNNTTTSNSKSRDTIMDIYDNHFFESDEEDNKNTLPVNNSNNQFNVPQASIPTFVPNKENSNVKQKLLPIPPNNQPAVHQPVKDFSHVQMTYIQPPTAQLSSISISPQQQPQDPSSSFSLNNHSSPVGMKSNMNDKPSSPRAIEVQRAVIPEVMHAVTQKTDDYMSNSRPRTSSINHNQPRSHPQQQQPRQNGYPSQQSRQQMPPHHQQQQRQPQPHHQQQPQQRQHQQQRQPQQQPQHHHQQQRQPQPQQQPQQRPHPPQHHQHPQHHQQQHHNQQQQQRPGPPSQSLNSYNNARPIPSPSHSPNMSHNTARRPAPGGQQPSSLASLQQPPGRFISPSPSMSNLQSNGSLEELNSPPHSVSIKIHKNS